MGLRVITTTCDRVNRCHSHDVVDGEEVCPYPEKPQGLTLTQWFRIKLSRFFAWLARVL